VGRATARSSGWVVLLAGLTSIAVVNRLAPSASQSVVRLLLLVFFLALVTRLVFAARRQSDRRIGLVLLIVAVSLWAAGAAVVNASGHPDLATFPGLGESFFLAAYPALAGFVLRDTTKSAPGGVVMWLEAVIVCGGTTCLAASLLLTAAGRAVQQHGLPALLALLYPLADIVLGGVVAAQIVLRSRAARSSLGLLAGFGLLAAADTHFISNLTLNTYDFGLVSITSWGLGFALLVDSASRPRRAAVGITRPSPGGLAAVVVAAGVAATAVLAFQPAGLLRNYLIAPALITLVAAGARLVVALRAASRAADAVELSLTDDLTLLPNRRALQLCMTNHLQTGNSFALMILDLDGFKEVNDTLGHLAGDEVLRRVAARISDTLEPDVLVARLGGDEFALVLPRRGEADARFVAGRVLDSVRDPLTVEGVTVSMTGSIGITLQGSEQPNPTELLRQADVAMYQAKHQRTGTMLYDRHTDDFSRDRLQLAEALRIAIAQGQLQLWYQPQIDASTRQLRGLEALVRWHHPQRGLLTPAAFLPAARRAGLMQDVSLQVSRIAISDLLAWSMLGLHPQVALNCAAPELMNGVVLPKLADALREVGLPAAQLVIEVTEESLLVDPERARALLLALRTEQFQISLDDYGTGYSSLAYLRDLPVQELKMDRSFIASMRSNPRSRVIIASTLQMARDLGLRTVAEGVEDSLTMEEMIMLGVDVLQGYHLSRPLPPTAITPLLQSNTTTARPRSSTSTETDRPNSPIKPAVPPSLAP
jgi:diguanylate cyclase (GGDEF)-like protein